jgi:predicted nucleotidyltransferase
MSASNVPEGGAYIIRLLVNTPARGRIRTAISAIFVNLIKPLTTPMLWWNSCTLFVRSVVLPLRCHDGRVWSRWYTRRFSPSVARTSREADGSFLADGATHEHGAQMTDSPACDPILRRFRAAINEVYGNRIERVVLFGSRARGDARPDSDYDIALFLRDSASFWDELGPLSEIETDILYDTGAVISAKPFPAGAYRKRTPFMNEIRRDGLDL